MKAHIVLAHPEPNSFNGQLAGLSRTRLSGAGYECTVSGISTAWVSTPARDRAFSGSQGRRPLPHPDRTAAQRGRRHVAARDRRRDRAPVEVRPAGRTFPAMVVRPASDPEGLDGPYLRLWTRLSQRHALRRWDLPGQAYDCLRDTGASADHCAHNGREGDTRLLVWPILFPLPIPRLRCAAARYHARRRRRRLHGGTRGRARYHGNHDQGLDEGAGAHSASRPAFQFNRDADFDDRGQLLPEARELSPFIRHQR